MSPLMRMSATAISLTVVVMYHVVPALQLAVNSHFVPDVIKQWLPQAAGAFGTLLALFLGASVYKLFLAAISLALTKFVFVKKWIFGPYYLEGTWVGFYRNDNGTFYVTDVIEQSLELTVVRGVGYSVDANQGLIPRARWQSDAVRIEPIKGVVDFPCAVDLLFEHGTRDTFTKLAMRRASASNGPTHLDGETSEVNSSVRHEVHQKKLSDSTLIDGKSSVEEAIAYYESWKSLGRIASAPPPNSHGASSTAAKPLSNPPVVEQPSQSS